MEPMEQQTFQHIYASYNGALYRYLVKRTGNENDAADLAQEAFIRLYEKKVNPETAASWLYTTGYRLFVDHWRKKRKAKLISYESIPEMSRLEQHCQLSPEHAAIGNELCAEIREAMQQLRPRDRKVLLLLAQRDCSYREIAEKIGISENAAKIVVHRARKRMRELMQAK